MAAEGAGRTERVEKRYSFIAGVGVIDDVRLYRGDKIVRLAEALTGIKLDRDVLGPYTAVDVYYSLFMPVPLLETDSSLIQDKSDLMRYMLIQRLLAERRLTEIRKYTVADSLTSVVAAASILEKLSRLLPREMSSSPGQGGEGEDSESRSGGGESNIDEDKLSDAISQAINEAIEDAKKAKDIKSVLMKSGAGTGSVLAFDESPEEILRLARETDIENILKYIAGIKLAFREDKKTVRYSRGWFRGLEYGSDLERLHPSQLALPDEIFYAEFANERLLLFEKALPSEKGPIYVLLDKSGSMIGEKINWARAVAVALLQKAVKERRPFYARFFDSIVYPLLEVRRISKASDVLKALSYLARVKAGGGTRIMNAIFTATEDIRSRTLPDRVSDIVLITDGEDRIRVEMVEQMKRKASAKLHTVMVMGDNQYLRKVSDHYMEVKQSLEPGTILKVVDFLDEAG